MVFASIYNSLVRLFKIRNPKFAIAYTHSSAPLRQA